jgi:hypothetical protein
VGTVPVYVPTGFTVAELLTYGQAVAEDLDDLTGLQITAMTLSTQLALPVGLKATPTDGYDINKAVNFSYDAANTDYRHTIRVPGVLSTLLVGELVLDTDPIVTAWNSDMVSGDATVDPSDKYGNDLTGFIQGVVSFRKS